MKIQIEGDEKKIKQLIKELAPRCKKDKVNLELVEDVKVIKEVKRRQVKK